PWPTFFRLGSRTTTSAQPVANCSVAAPAPPPTSSRRTPETGARSARISARSAALFRTLALSMSRTRTDIGDSPECLERDESSRNFAAEDLAGHPGVDVPSGDDTHDAAFPGLARERRGDGRSARAFGDDPVPLDEQSDRGRNLLQGDDERPFEQRPHQVPHLWEDARRADPVDHRGIRERMDERPPLERCITSADADLPDLVP